LLLWWTTDLARPNGATELRLDDATATFGAEEVLALQVRADRVGSSGVKSSMTKAR
jgi:hypothetical protein